MKTISRVISSAVMLAFSVGLCIFATKMPPIFALWYPRFSNWILGVIGDVTARVSFPIWEAVTVFLVLWGVYTFFRGIVKHKFLRWLSGLLWGVSFGTMLFVLFWGAGHFAPTKTEQIVTVREYSVQELLEATEFYGQKAGEYVDSADLSDIDSLLQRTGDGYAALRNQYDCFPEAEVKVKKLLGGKLFSHLGTTGIFVPMTSEASVNPDTYPSALPFTMCHEVAHRLGAAAEEDANFCAFLACSSNPDVSFRYSAYFSAFIYCYNSLFAADRTLAEEVFKGLNPALQADIRATSAHYAPYKGKIRDTAQSLNDTYLKAMGQAGVQSYGMVSDALIAWYQQNL